MEVLLLEDVDRLGLAGDIKKVADGYARNFLFPRGLAELATPGAVKQAEKLREATVRRQAQALSEAQALAQQLDGMSVSFEARAGETDRLYGSITNVNIAEALSEKAGLEVDRRKIVMAEPLKELGTHAVTIHLAPEAEAKVTVVIVREDDIADSEPPDTEPADEIPEEVPATEEEPEEKAPDTQPPDTEPPDTEPQDDASEREAATEED
jgi:large subunit ribosomal protein L9